MPIDASRLCEDATFDLIISDIGIPNMDGSELIAKLRRQPQTALVPAIALTGYGRPQDIQGGAGRRVTAHLIKPVELQRLGCLTTELVKDSP